MPILIIIVAVLTLAICLQVYRLTDSRTNGTIINALVVVTAMVVSFSLLNTSTGTTVAQDSTRNIPVLETAFIQSSGVTDTINATGSIVPSRDVSLAFQYSAHVTEVLVEVGDRVEEGQVLARLDGDDINRAFQNAVFNTQNEQLSFDELLGQPRDVDLAAAEAALQAAQLNFGGSTVLTGEGSTQAEIQRMQLQLSQNRMWQVAMQRDDTIQGFQEAGAELEEGDFGDTTVSTPLFSFTLPGPERDDAVERFDASVAQYYQALNSLNSVDANRAYNAAQLNAELTRPPRYGGSPGAALQRTQAQQQLERLLNGPNRDEIEFSQIDLALANLALEQTELQLDYIELIAPFSGVVTEVNMTVGEIPPFNAIMIMDDSQFKVNLDIDEIDIMQVRVGQPVQFIVDALPDDNITGLVEHVALTPNQNSQVVSYNVRVVLDQTDAPIRAGMSATGQVVISSVQGALGVSARFIYNDAITGTPYVIAQTPENGLQRIPVIIGESGDQLIQIMGGITSGQQVVLVAADDVEQIPYRGNTNG